MSSTMLARTNFVRLVEHIHWCVSDGSSRAIAAALDWLQCITSSEGIVLCQVAGGEQPTLTRLVNHSYDQRWVDVYLGQKFQEIDPVLRYSRARDGLFGWDEAYDASRSAHTRRFMEAAADHGLGKGYAYSFRSRRVGPSGLTTICSFYTGRESLGTASEDVLQALVPALHTAGAVTPAPEAPPLSDREIEVIRWSREGKTVWEVARILSISDDTVKFHLKNIYRKLRVTNRAQAVAEAIRMGVV